MRKNTSDSEIEHMGIKSFPSTYRMGNESFTMIETTRTKLPSGAVLETTKIARGVKFGERPDWSK